ncbi:MAG: LPS export ABC transporter periplasmic protein LptC [Burkholderiales bacterium]
MSRFTQFFPFLLLGVLAVLTFWLDQSVQPGTKTSEAERHDPDYIIENVVARRMDTSGEVKHTLYAQRMIHYPDDDTTHLESPRFVSSGSARAPISITSRTARVSSGGDNIYFETDVRAARAAYADRSELVLTTSFLHVIPDENLARTDRPVTVTDAHTVANAVGLELNSETRIVKFLSRFEGTYHDPGRATRK